MDRWEYGPPDRQVPVSVLTGFLGSGKTTLLNRLVRAPGAGRLAVLVNEFGAIALDHDLIAHAGERTVVLAGGCVCCALRGDLQEAMLSLVARRDAGEVPPFERLAIETTGLADPGPILQTFMADPMVAARLRPDGVVTVVDAVNGDGTLDRHRTAVRQVAHADRLLLSKLDLATAESAAALRRRLGAINPAAAQSAASSAGADMLGGYGFAREGGARADAWLRAEAGGEAGADAIATVSATLDTPIEPVAFERWLQGLLRLRGAGLLRLKGIVHLRGLPGPAVVHGVQHVLHAPVVLARWPSADRRTRLVFITEGIARAAIDDALRDLDPGLAADAARFIHAHAADRAPEDSHAHAH